MRSLALTCNGPGEFSGWVRPLLRALYAEAPTLDVTIFFVPDDYATGREPDVARGLFPQARIVKPAAYLRFAVGASLEGVPTRVDRVHYSGGDLGHAIRLHERLGGIATSYKFSSERNRRVFTRVFAVDEANREQLRGWTIPDERITVVGNLAIDGAISEAAGDFGDLPSDVARAGIIILPGSRKLEVANLIPFFLGVASRMRERDPRVPIAFGLSPFTTDDEVARAIERGGDPRVFGMRGTLERDGEAIFLRENRSGARFPVVRAAMRAAAVAAMAVTIPGTKAIELAALGIPTVVCLPFNAPELAVINGPLQYLGRLPLIGAPLKRGVVLAVAARFKYAAQPNIDADRELMTELRGTLTPGRVAGVVLERLADAAWRTRVSGELRTLYAGHVGAAKRVAAALLSESNGS